MLVKEPREYLLVDLLKKMPNRYDIIQGKES